MHRPHVLIVDDDIEIRSMLRRVLLANDYEIDAVGDVASGVRLTKERRPDVVIMDIGLPDGDGVDAVNQLRTAGIWVPVLMLTAHGHVERRIESFRAGADDFLAKPFHVDELLARLTALIRRAQPTTAMTTEAERMRRGDVVLDVAGRRCWRGPREIELSSREFELLELLMRNAGTAISRSQLVDEIWDGDVTEGSNPADVYVGYLRRKLESGGEQRVIRTVRGHGFMFTTPTSRT
jgi:DNA-binding response OmpR family regulator